MDTKLVIRELDKIIDRLNGLIVDCEIVARILNPDGCPTFYSTPMAWADVLRGMKNSAKAYRDRFYAIVEGGK